MTLQPYELLVQQWQQRAQQDRFYYIPEPQMYQMLSYTQMDPAIFDVVIDTFPAFLQQLKYLKLEQFVWSPAFMDKHRDHFRKMSFFRLLDPTLSGELSLEYVKNRSDSFALQPQETIRILLQEHNFHLSYTPSTAMQMAWFTADPQHYCQQYIRQVCYHRITNDTLKEDMQRWDHFYQLYVETKHPLFEALIQRPALPGLDREVRLKCLEHMKTQSIQPWNKSDLESYLQQNADFIMDTIAYIFIVARPKSMDAKERRLWLWNNVKRWGTQPHLLLKMTDQFFDTDLRLNLFEQTILQDKDRLFRQLHETGVLTYQDYTPFLLNKLEGPKHSFTETNIHL